MINNYGFCINLYYARNKSCGKIQLEYRIFSGIQTDDKKRAICDVHRITFLLSGM